MIVGRMYSADYMTPDSLEDVRELCRQSYTDVEHVYLHWTAGWYGQAYDDYHICIDENGEIYIMCDTINDHLNHTYMRNSNSVGISLMCCAEAVANNGHDSYLGPEPPTAEQIEVMSQVVAVMVEEFGFDLSSANDVMTHCEAAFVDGYGPGSGDPETRWDLWYIPDFYGKNGDLVPGGDLIRGKAAFYYRKWNNLNGD